MFCSLGNFGFQVAVAQDHFISNLSLQVGSAIYWFRVTHMLPCSLRVIEMSKQTAGPCSSHASSDVCSGLAPAGGTTACARPLAAGLRRSETKPSRRSCPSDPWQSSPFLRVTMRAALAWRTRVALAPRLAGLLGSR